MGRPTNEPKNKLIGIRLDKELEDFFVTGKENISESVRIALREYVKRKNLAKQGFVEQNKSSVKQNSMDFVKHYEELQSKFNELSARVMPEANEYFKNEQYDMLKIVPVGFKGGYEKSGEISADLYAGIMDMVSTYHMSYEEFMEQIMLLMKGDFITSEVKGKLKTFSSDISIESFFKKCDQYGISDYQRTFDNMVKTARFI